VGGKTDEAIFEVPAATAGAFFGAVNAAATSAATATAAGAGAGAAGAVVVTAVVTVVREEEAPAAGGSLSSLGASFPFKE
jgi:hypothetical protein